MSKFEDGNGVMEKLRAALLMLGFGLGTLAFLVAIDRPEWFVLRPATGTAAAMSLAGHASNAIDAADAVRR